MKLNLPYSESSFPWKWRETIWIKIRLFNYRKSWFFLVLFLEYCRWCKIQSILLWDSSFFFGLFILCLKSIQNLLNCFRILIMRLRCVAINNSLFCQYSDNLVHLHTQNLAKEKTFQTNKWCDKRNAVHHLTICNTTYRFCVWVILWVTIWWKRRKIVR